MTIQEFYSRIGGNYGEIIQRLGNDTRIEKVLRMLPRDESMGALRAAIEKEDCESAFRAAHTLKGIVMNLGLARMTEAIVPLTEALRSGAASAVVEPLFAQVETCYAAVMEAIVELLGQDETKKGDDARAAAQ